MKALLTLLALIWATRWRRQQQLDDLAVVCGGSHEYVHEYAERIRAHEREHL